MVPVTGVVVAGDGAPRCRGVYGTYFGGGAGVDADTSVVVLPEAVGGLAVAGKEVAGGGDRRGCAVRLSYELVRWELWIPERPMDPVGNSPSRRAIVSRK